MIMEKQIPSYQLCDRRLMLIVAILLLVAISWDAVAQTNSTIDPINPDQIHGELRSRQVTSLSSELPARIEKITLREGYRFKKGTVLVKLDCALIRAQHRKTEAALVAAKRKFAVEKRLLELNSTGELDVQDAEAEMGKVLADMEAGQVRLSKCVIKAPFSVRHQYGGRISRHAHETIYLYFQIFIKNNKNHRSR